jgi:hypothetical protein
VFSPLLEGVLSEYSTWFYAKLSTSGNNQFVAESLADNHHGCERPETSGQYLVHLECHIHQLALSLHLQCNGVPRFEVIEHHAQRGDCSDRVLDKLLPEVSVLTDTIPGSGGSLEALP